MSKRNIRDSSLQNLEEPVSVNLIVDESNSVGMGVNLFAQQKHSACSEATSTEWPRAHILVPEIDSPNDAKRADESRQAGVFKPRVAICVPVLNGVRFLRPRLLSILGQTLEDWELIFLDGYSTDGTWQVAESLLRGDPRATLARQEPEGIYHAINETIKRSTADFIYIATADDTMSPDCLEKLLALAQLGASPAIAQCGLTIIDAHGIPVSSDCQWPLNTELPRSLRSAFEYQHHRRCPYDGAGVLLFSTLITSLTQALFPREAFLKFGYFPSDFGSAGDMAMEGLLGFFYDVHYTPERLATWRLHETQATRNPKPGDASWPDRRIAICDWILTQLAKHDPALERKARKIGLHEYSHFWKQGFTSGPQAIRRPFGRLTVGASLTKHCPNFYRRYLQNRILGHASDSVDRARLSQLSAFLHSDGQCLIATDSMGEPESE